ncbi:MAG: hypothetical protein KF909_06680, partial [Rhodocyclaceae bacterium]|nr:hypothetical protein [Rhodocyclaceae bacterium]
TPVAEAPVAPPTATAPMEPAAPAAAQLESPPSPQSEAVSEPAATEATEAAETPAPTEEVAETPALVADRVPSEAPVAEEPVTAKAAQPVASPVQQMIDLGAPLEEIGLQMVETNPDKLATVAPVEAEAAPKLGRRPRPRPTVETEELQQVQTGTK